ncbi:MAG: SatD family protein [Candidatus Methanospirareceae archaeon]
MKEKLYVLLGDVVSSTRIVNRDIFQKKIMDACMEINKLYANDIVANFKILKGLDEIGGVLFSSSKVYDVVTILSDRLYPNSMRFALAFDHIDTAVESKDVAKMDGPAFHKASDIILELKQTEKYFAMFLGYGNLDKVIGGTINLILTIKEEWSQKEHHIVNETKKGKTQVEIAKELGITQQAVSKTLKRLMWKELEDLEEDLRSFMKIEIKKLENMETAWYKEEYIGD